MPYSALELKARKRRRRALQGLAILCILLTAAALQILVVVHPDQMALRVRSVLHALGPAGLEARSVSWSWPDRIELAGIEGRLPGAGTIQAGKAVVRHRFRDLFAGAAAPRSFSIKGTALLVLDAWDSEVLFSGLDRLGTLGEVRIDRLIVSARASPGTPSLILRDASASKGSDGWQGRAAIEGPGFSDGTLGFRANGRSHTIQLSNLDLGRIPSEFLPAELAAKASELGLRGTAGVILEGGGSLGWKAVLRFHDAGARPAVCPIEIEGLSGHATIDASGFLARGLSGRALGGSFQLIGPGLRLDGRPEAHVRMDRALIEAHLGALLPESIRAAWNAFAPLGELADVELGIGSNDAAPDSRLLRGKAVGLRLAALPGASYRGPFLVGPGRIRLDHGVVEAGAWRLDEVGATFAWDGSRWRCEDFRALSSGAQLQGALELRAAEPGSPPGIGGRLAAASLPLAAFLHDQDAVGLIAAEFHLDGAAWSLSLRFSGADPGTSSPLSAVYGKVFPGLRRWADAGLLRLSGSADSAAMDRLLLKLPGICVAGSSRAPSASGEPMVLVVFQGPLAALEVAYAGGAMPADFERVVLHGTMRSLQVRERAPASPDDPALRAAFLGEEARAFFDQ